MSCGYSLKLREHEVQVKWNPEEIEMETVYSVK